MTTELATIPNTMHNVATSESMFLLHPEMERRSNMLAKSTMIPESFRNNPSNCMIALDIALRLQMNPLMIMQNLYIVQGRPSWSGQFLIACINKSGLFKTPLRFKFSGQENTDNYGCVAYAIDKNGELLESTKITIGMAKAEKWWSKKVKVKRDGVERIEEISKWQSMPQQMFQYRAAAFFARTYCPEITMGLMTQDEVIDIQVVPTTYTSTLPSAPETPVTMLEVETTVPPLPSTPDTPVDVLDEETAASTPAVNPMWDGISAEFPIEEYDRQAEIENVKQLINEGYFSMDDYKEAMRLYGVQKVSDLSETGFESFALAGTNYP
ncbi:MAG: recombinase RecT [Planctomycetaceae bacterium]|nr:recombinase RecT [Planctomycetaceae bacterium]